MKNYGIKLSTLVLIGAIFAAPAASHADGIRINLLGLHIAIGHRHCPPPVVVVDCWDWRWRRDHGYDDWRWYRDHPNWHHSRDDYYRDHGHDRGFDRHDRR